VPFQVGYPAGLFPAGPPEWPRKGGLVKQENRLVQVHQLLLVEWPHCGRREKEKPKTPEKRKR